MIRWTRQNVFRLLCMFGDDLEHSWLEVINIGTRLFLDVRIESAKDKKNYKYHTDKFEDFFKKAVNYGLVEKRETEYIRDIKKQKSYQLCERDYVYKISKKGDLVLRTEQAERTGDWSYFKNYDRTVDGRHGIDHYAPLTPTDYGVKEKHKYRIKK